MNKDDGLAVSVLVFGIAVLALQCGVMLKRGTGWGPMSFRLVGFSIVAIAAMFFAVADVNEDTVAPTFGILGAIVGYLAGTSAKENGTSP